jgi:hypothetical protein
VKVSSGTIFPYYLAAIAEAARADSIRLFEDGATGIPYLLDLMPTESAVRYPVLIKDGLFGQKHVMREVRVGFSARLSDSRSREVRYSSTTSGLLADTIAVEEIDGVESPGIPATHALVPPDHGIDRYIEPFVIIGAAGVAVYLLFHLRSS